MRFVFRAFAVALLAVGVVAGPTVAANASSGVTITWVSLYSSITFTYPCSGTHTQNGTNGWYVAYVNNGCSGRVWLHAQLNGGGNSYCVNPRALAYGIPGSFEQILVSGTGTDCDAGTNMSVTWAPAASPSYTSPYGCSDGFTTTDYDNEFGVYIPVGGVNNRCNVRIWLHVTVSGGGSALCISPGTSVDNPMVGNTGGLFYQVQISSNQAPCSAG